MSWNEALVAPSTLHSHRLVPMAFTVVRLQKDGNSPLADNDNEEIPISRK